MFTIDYIKSNKSRQDIRGVCEKNGVHLENNFFSPSISRLYKYSSLNNYSIKDLKNGQITSTCPTEFNDLFDSSMSVDYKDLWLEDLESLNQSAEKIGYKPPIDEEFKLYAKDEAEKMSNLMRDSLKEFFNVACFSSSNDNVLMWAHYAKENTGFCLEYDTNKMNETLKKFIFPIIYVDRPIDVTELLESKDNDDIALSALISIVSKYKEWGYEREFRLVLYFGNKVVRSQINMPEPSKIYLGNKFSNSYQSSKNEDRLLYESFFSYVEDNKIELLIAQRQRKSFEINFLPTSVQKIKNNEMEFL